MVTKRSWTDEQLREAVESTTTYAATLRRLGLSGSGAVHWDVKSRVEALGLDTSHFASSVDSRRTSDAELRDAVVSATTFVMVLERLGVPTTSTEHQRVRRRVRALQLDISHFVRVHDTSRSSARRWTDDMLRSAVAGSRSVAGVLRGIGLVPAGGNYDQVQRRIRELGLDTSHFTGAGWNVDGKFRPRVQWPTAEVLVADRWVGSHKLKKRLFRERLKQPVCELCGWAARREHDGVVLVELDHKNGDRNDNRIENLRILCPNCHALQPTHRGLNQKRRKP